MIPIVTDEQRINSGETFQAPNSWAPPVAEEAPEAAPPEKTEVAPNFERGAGSMLRDWLGGGKPMGSWTGLPMAIGAPLSGALIGSGIGLSVHGIRERLIPWLVGREPKRSKNAWRRAATTGALAGLGLGGYAAYKKASAYNPAEDAGRLIRIILHDRSLSEMQKQEALNRISTLSRQDVYRLNASAALGALTGAALATILGVGPLPGFIAGGMMGSMFAPRSRFTF